MAEVELPTLGNKPFNPIHVRLLTPIVVKETKVANYTMSMDKKLLVKELLVALAKEMEVTEDALAFSAEGRDLDLEKTIGENGFVEPGPAARKAGHKVDVICQVRVDVVPGETKRAQEEQKRRKEEQEKQARQRDEQAAQKRQEDEQQRRRRQEVEQQQASLDRHEQAKEAEQARQRRMQRELLKLGFQLGDLVEAHSLNAAQLNGLRGRVEGLQGERLQVEFGELVGGKALRPVNLRLVSEPMVAAAC